MADVEENGTAKTPSRTEGVTAYCAATTKAGKPCPQRHRPGSAYCTAHSKLLDDPALIPDEVRRFGGHQPNAGRPKRKTATELWQDMVERNLLVILGSHFRALGVTAEMTDEGIVLREVPGGGAKLSASFEGEVIVSDDADDLKTQMAAAQVIIERALGRPAQSIALTGDGGGPVLLRLGQALSDDAARTADDLADQLALEAGDDAGVDDAP